MNGEGEKYGEGIEYQANKFVYRGQFREGKRNGTGVLKIYNSAQKVSIYIGQFIDGIKHGEGKQFDENGVKYEGEWKDGKKDGFGRLYLGHNESYEGTFEKGLKSSHGT
jgi:radial spoke head protein 1